MKVSIIVVVEMAAMLGGCLAIPGRFSPVQGPLSKQSPIPTYAATMSGVLSGTSITVVIPIEMAADCDSVYGTGYFAAHVLGNKLYARATLTGNMGSVLHVEFSNENNTRGNTKGVAEDNKGNIFKVSVYN